MDGWCFTFLGINVRSIVSLFHKLLNNAWAIRVYFRKLTMESWLVSLGWPCFTLISNGCSGFPFLRIDVRSELALFPKNSILHGLRKCVSQVLIMHGLRILFSQVSLKNGLWKCISLVDHGTLLALHLDYLVPYYLKWGCVFEKSTILVTKP
jgi:uncharacterized membrane protein